MRKATVEWALDASGFMMSLAVWVFPLVLVTTAVLVIFRRTRPLGGMILCSFSMLVGAATWFFGAAATFASFGWFGLIVGLLLLGLGVVPLGIIGGFVYLDGVAPTIIILLVATFAFRGAGVWLVGLGLGDNESKVGPLTPDQKQAVAQSAQEAVEKVPTVGEEIRDATGEITDMYDVDLSRIYGQRIFNASEFSNDPEQMEKLGIEIMESIKNADEDMKAADNEVEVVDPVANTPAQERGRIPGVQPDAERPLRGRERAD